MRTIDELGISPTPWENHKQFVIAKDDGSVVAASNVRDASLIAAAPELYDCLYEAIELCCEGEYPNCDGCCINGETHGNCHVKKWIRALQKANGKELNL